MQEPSTTTQYVNRGKRWTEAQDTELKAQYLAWRALGGHDFDSFIAQLCKAFGRAPGGITSRLAGFFDDVPGWDYEAVADRDAWRAEQKTKATEELLARVGADVLAALLKAYEQYVEARTETYRTFTSRLAEQVGLSGQDVTAVLKAQVPEVVKYVASDLTSKRRTATGEESIVVDFSDNPESQQALHLMEDTQEHVFLTGEAGTGKSTLLQYFRQTTKKNVVVLAPTGVAALNVRGQTIHSFCGFGPDITVQKVKRLGAWSPKKKLLQKVSMIVIDEISMVRADLLDCVDKFLRLNGPAGHVPFGGVQMVFIGDLFQLPPVEKGFVHQYANGTNNTNEAPLFPRSGANPQAKYASPYFFDSEAFRHTTFQYVQLKTIYRQQDRVFIDVLNAVRNNALTEEHLQIINQRALGDGEDKFEFEQFAVYLTPTNTRARQVNNFFLARLPGQTHIFSGHALGSFEDRELPTDLRLEVKVGAQIMMLNNDQRKRWVNGTMGKVVAVRARDNNHDHDNDHTERGWGRTELDGYPQWGGHGRPTSIDLEYVTDDFSAPEYAPGLGVSQQRVQASHTDILEVELETGEVVQVEPYTWEMYKFVLDPKTQSIESESTGSFTQFPCKLAWAVTIHKAQGKTFGTVYIDLASGTFAHGQLYVALSRCRTLEGLHLRRPVTPDDVILDDRVVKFMSSLQ